MENGGITKRNEYGVLGVDKLESWRVLSAIFT